MKQNKTIGNIFVVNTPHQLLNAIEAVHSLQLMNNHLLVARPRNGALDRFMSLINSSDWATVSFPLISLEPSYDVQKRLSPAINRWYCRYVHFRKMRALAKVTARFRRVDKLFLGHYSAQWTPFMRHLANTIKYKTLCLLDDGTDTIEIIENRHRSERRVREAPIDERNVAPSVCKTLLMHLRAKYWDLNLAEAPSVTFFTIYDLDVRQSDLLIRNSYSYLRSLVPFEHKYMRDTVIFIGLCSDDNCFEMRSYLEFLSNAKEHFHPNKMIYVAHPRDSASCVTQIREHLQCELWPSCSVIEYDLVAQGIKPKAIAGFVSSALITLAHLMDADVEIVCFQIAQENWISWREDAVGVYEYIKRKAHGRVSVVPLCLQSEDAIAVTSTLSQCDI
jgi:hypothetical protein